MQEALHRLEAGEDADQIEADMGDRLEGDEPFVLPGKKARGALSARVAPRRDDTLYELYPHPLLDSWRTP